MQRRGEESVSFNLCLTLPKSSWGRNVMPLFDYSYLQIEGQISDLCEYSTHWRKTVHPDVVPCAPEPCLIDLHCKQRT